MGNTTNAENWAAQERLRAIERGLWWRGWLKRKDIQQIFGLSMAQTSSDFQKYQELNPDSMRYNLKTKRYEATETMTCILQAPQFEDAVRIFLSKQHIGHLPTVSTTDSQTVAILSLPTRSGTPNHQRMIVQAYLNNKAIKLKYWSVTSGKAMMRSIIPRAFGHDGYRWHVRAWCCENKDYRDFVISRISQTKGLHDYEEILPDDHDWNTVETIKLKPNSKLSDNARRAIELDYGIRKNATLKIQVRTAMKHYLMSHLRVDSVKLNKHFEILP